MRLTRGKVIIIAIFVGIALTFVGLIAFERLEGEYIRPNITVTMETVKMKGININNPDLMIVLVEFAILNETEQTLVVSKIDYDMYANESLVGRGNLSFLDIPLTGRAPLFPNSSTILPSEMQLRKSPEVIETWEKLVNDDTEDITWHTKGVAQIESAFSIIEIDINSTL
ncbi:MAG: hypothetical protein V3T40_02390 [Nitrososphaerales archaeon]